MTQTTVNLVSDKIVKESPQLAVIAKQQRRYEHSLGGRGSVKSVNSQSLCDVPEVARLNDEDTPEDDIVDEDHQRSNDTVKKRDKDESSEKFFKPMFIRKSLKPEDEANQSMVQDEYYKVNNNVKSKL